MSSDVVEFQRVFDQRLSLAVSHLRSARLWRFSAADQAPSSPIAARFPSNIVHISPRTFASSCRFLRHGDSQELGDPFLYALYAFLLEKANRTLAGADLQGPATHGDIHGRVVVSKITDPERGALVGQDGVFARGPIGPRVILCEYGGLVDLESEHHRRALQLERPNSEEKTLLLSSSLEWAELQGEEDEEGKRPSLDRVVIDGYFHQGLGPKFNDFRRNPFKHPRQGELEPGRPNCRFVEVEICGWPHVFMATEVACAEGEELTVDYGEAFWETLRFHHGLEEYAKLASTEGGRVPAFKGLLQLLSRL